MLSLMRALPGLPLLLGISQQVVSKQLFGVMRKGRRVGGAIRKLRKILEASGVHFEEDES